MSHGARTLLGLALALGAAGANAQVLTHAAADPRGQVAQSVELDDPWEDPPGDGLYATAAPRDVEVRVARTSPTAEDARVSLVLFGPWGTFLYGYDEVKTEVDGVTLRVTRTERRALDLDADGQNEIVLVERRAESRIALDEQGVALHGDGPRFADFAVAVRLLDREGDTLVERDVVPDPDAAGFALLLSQSLPGAVLAGLQQAAADHLFAIQQFEKARYRYQAAVEWAERGLTSGETKRLSADSPLTRTDPDEPAVVYLAARRRLAALPPRFRFP